MKRFIGGKAGEYALAFALMLGVWLALTLVYPPLVVPGPVGVARKVLAIFGDGASLHAVWLTTLRLLAGLGLGVGVGSGLGVLLGYSPRLRGVCQPLLGLIQAVPPVSWLVLALIWFGFNGRPSVFIVALSTLPTLTINLVEGIRNVDAKLVQMGRVYGFSRLKRFRFIAAPSILPYFRSGVRIAVGIGCKAVIMGEVLTTSNGIGGAITDARLNLDPEGVVAWTVVMVVVYYLLDRLAARLLRGPGGGTC